MYEYLDRPPQAGDIVECQIKNQAFTKGKLYIAKGVHQKNDQVTAVVLDDKGSTTNGIHKSYFKVVKTLPGSEAKVGDTCIRIGIGCTECPHGTVFIVTHLNGKCVGYMPNYSADPSIIRVLCLAETKPKAYYKRSGEPWAIEELKQIPNYNCQRWRADKILKFAYAHQGEYLTWSMQRPEFEPQNYNLVAFEDEFPDIETLPITIPIGSHWQEMYTSTSKGPIVEVVKLGTETVHFEDLGTTQRRIKTLSDFLNRFVPISKPALEAYRPGAQSEPTQRPDMLTSLTRALKPLHKEQPMTFQQLIHSIFQEEIQTDYDKKPNFLVVIYNNEGTEIAQATADSVKQVEDKIQSTPKLWGAKAVIYSIDSEVQTAVPVTTTKLKKSK